MRSRPHWAREYEVDAATLHADLQAFADDLLARGLLVQDDVPRVSPQLYAPSLFDVTCSGPPPRPARRTGGMPVPVKP